jgi:hypothetical protein
MVPAIQSHKGTGNYFYVDGQATVQVPPGNCLVSVGHGYEWNPVVLFPVLTTDTTLFITLTRFSDMPSRRWYSGDMHVHGHHAPIEYDIGPADAMRVARAEGLAVLHMLDQEESFTGAPHPLSDAQTVLSYSYELRNQTYGHAPLPGLAFSPAPELCCLPPEPAWPMLHDMHAQLAGTGLLVLGHPRTTGNFLDVADWPGAGLGRELPVLAALGSLDAIDVLSYSNRPYEAWADWYDVLSAGLRATPTAGTDAVLNKWDTQAVGGLRVYARLAPGAPFSHAAWLDAVRAGRTFVTSDALIPEFSVNGRTMGDTLEVAGDTMAPVFHLRAESAIGLDRVVLIADGVEAWARPIVPSGSRTVYDTTLTLAMPTPAWVAARVHSRLGSPQGVYEHAVAHTNAVRITRHGAPVRRLGPSIRWLATLDSLEALVTARGGWTAQWHLDSVLARLERAREVYRLAWFEQPPAAFDLIAPPTGTTVTAPVTLAWEASFDPDSGDAVRYRVRIAADSTLANATELDATGTSITPALAANATWWWTVEAVDRAGHRVPATDGLRRFHLLPATAGAGGPASPVRPRAEPNPARGAVRILGVRGPIEIVDVAGRRVAWSGRGITADGDGLRWDGSGPDSPAPAGIYWVRAPGVPLLRIALLR